MTNSSDFRAALGELVETTYPEPVDHPSAERWLAYQRGEPADEEARLAEHLVRCRDCCEIVQAAEALFGPDAEPEAARAGEEFASHALWRQLRPQLFGAREAPAGRAGRPGWQFRLPYALAASFFLALLGMTVWNLEQRSALQALRAPRPDAPIYDFSAGERLPETDEKKLTAGSGSWTFLFHPTDEGKVYRLAIRDAETGRELYSYELQLNDDRALTLGLPEGLPPGRYRLELSDGAGESAGRVLETHLLHVVPAGRGG